MKLSTITQRFISPVFLVALCGVCAYAQRLVVVGWNRRPKKNGGDDRKTVISIR